MSLSILPKNFLKPPQKPNTESAKQCIRHSIPTLINNYHDRTLIENIHSLSVSSIKSHFKIYHVDIYITNVNKVKFNCYSSHVMPISLSGYCYCLSDNAM